MEVFPDPATPWITRVPGASSRMTAFCSRWMEATMSCIFTSELRDSARASTSSRTLDVESAAQDSLPSSTAIWRLRRSVPSRRPAGASKAAGPDSKS